MPLPFLFVRPRENSDAPESQDGGLARDAGSLGNRNVISSVGGLPFSRSDLFSPNRNQTTRLVGFENDNTPDPTAENAPLNVTDPMGLTSNSVTIPRVSPDPPNRSVPVLLPDGSTFPPGCSTDCLMSPVADLAPVADAGRTVGNTYFATVANPEGAAGAAPYLAAALGANLGHGGTFDYQRQGNHVTGFKQLPQFRDVSNFNVGLFSQQAGLSLDDTLGIAGTFASLLSSNAKPGQPNGLDTKTRKFIVNGYNAGASGVFGPAAH